MDDFARVLHESASIAFEPERAYVASSFGAAVTQADKALKAVVDWSEGNEQDLYPYLKNLFQHALGYPQDRVRIGETKPAGYPDLSLLSRDSKPKDGVFWIVAEVKPDRGMFRSPEKRREVWDNQLKKYVSADTVYALLIDPVTVVALRPDGSEVKVEHLDEITASELAKNDHLGMLSYDNSLSDISLESFREGTAPHRYLDVSDEATRKKFYDALRLSSRELIDYSRDRLRRLLQEYAEMEREVAELEEKVPLPDDPAVRAAKLSILTRHASAKRFKEVVLPDFEKRIGRDLPSKPAEAERFLIDVYATEGSSLVLARILFVRFFEDHDLTTRKISNGGIKAFRNFYRDVKDDYRHLLSDAFKDLERRYRRLFEPSLFDLSHEGDGELSRLLLRVFYRMNAFDFTKVTGDILGNLYERFLDVDARKKLGEFYTPMVVARYILHRIGFYDNPGPLLDPACGSGTFLIAAVTGLIDRMQMRGVSKEQALRQAVELVHGLDINMFAAFITQLQLIWHLFPHLQQAGLKEIPDLKVYGGINSLVFDPQSTLGSSILQQDDNPIERGARVRDGRYRYVVGNPPYIRNERFKDWGDWRAFYAEVDYRNSDVAFFFVKRAIDGGRIDQQGKAANGMPPWLQDAGRMCWVLPLGVCDSAAAERLRHVVLKYRMFEVTDLEDVAHALFPSAIASTRATTAPVLLFAERTSVRPDAKTRLVRITKTCLDEQGIRVENAESADIPQSLFASPSPLNPYGQILTKLREEDVPILHKISRHRKFGELSMEPTPTYGIKVGKSGVISEVSGKNRLQLLKGQNIFSFFLNTTSSQWVNPSKCVDASIWKRGDLKDRPALVLSEIALAPQAAMFDPGSRAINNSGVIVVPKEDSVPIWEAILNSAPIRFVYLLTLRSGLIGVGTPVGDGKTAAWAHIYPRTVAAFPMPDLRASNELEGISDGLHKVATAIADRWASIHRTFETTVKRNLALHDVVWTGWEDYENVLDAPAHLGKRTEGWRLSFGRDSEDDAPFVEGTYDVLNVVAYLLGTMEAPVTRRALERLQVPVDPGPLSAMIDDARNPESSDIRRFKELLNHLDQIVMDGFGLVSSEAEHIKERLSTPPFDVLQPRWPWATVAIRQVQEYEEDRFE